MKTYCDPNLEYCRRMARILYAIEYLGRYCHFCKMDGFDFPWLIDFHHEDEKTKLYEVKNKLYGGSFNSHKEEIDKCILVCVSCHRNNHANVTKYNDNKKIILEKLQIIKENHNNKITKNYFLKQYDMDNILKLVNDGYIMTEIAKTLNLNYGTVKSFVRRNKLDPEKRFRIRISGATVVKLLNAKFSIRGISKKININRETLRQFINEKVNCQTLSNGVKIYSIIKIQ